MKFQHRWQNWGTELPFDTSIESKSMKTVLSVGQCGFDHGSITRFLRAHFDVDVTPAATAADGLAHLQQRTCDLVLVNRIFDADGDEGLEFIKNLKDDLKFAHLPVMLVTNYREYAEKATAIGALPGFGKSEVGSPELVKRLASLLSATQLG